MLQILTVGSHKFSTDSRFSVFLDFVNSDFQLVIRGLTPGDIGAYECQVNTIPVKLKVVTLALQSAVMTPVTRTPGPGVPSGHSPDLSTSDMSDVTIGGSSTSIIGSPDIYFKPDGLGKTA